MRVQRALGVVLWVDAVLLWVVPFYAGGMPSLEFRTVFASAMAALGLHLWFGSGRGARGQGRQWRALALASVLGLLGPVLLTAVRVYAVVLSR